MKDDQTQRRFDILHFNLAQVAGFLLLALTCGGETFALNPKKAITQYTYDVWTTSDGLPHNQINRIVQTRDGYMWLGTPVGLVRFDGLRFTLFDKANTKGIKGNNIVDLHEGRDGSLWIGTLGGGLIRLKEGKFTSYTTQEGLLHDDVRTVYEDQEGSLWIGTPVGLSRWKDGRWNTFTSKDNLRDDFINDIHEGSDGDIWVSTAFGLNLWKDGRIVPFDTGGLGYRDRAGNRWVIIANGVRRFKDGEVFTYGSKDGLYHTPSAFLEDRDGNLWMTALGFGLYRFTDGRFTSFTAKDGLVDKDVLSLYEDREGDIWIASRNGGLGRLKEGAFMSYTSQEGVPLENLEAIYEDSQGRLWICGPSMNGISFKDNRFTVHKGRLSSPITEGRDGSLWFGRPTLTRFKDGQLTSFSNLNIQDAEALYTDRQGVIWIGRYVGGLSRFENGELTTYTTKDGLSSNIVSTITEDHEGSLWIGTVGGGLTRLKDGKFTAFTTRDGLSSNAIESLYADAEGSLWIGTNGGGLTRLKNGKFTAYTTKQGLFYDVAFTILEDDRGNLWMGSGKGVYYVSKKELDELDAGKIRSVTSVSYGVSDGMKSISVIGQSQRSGCRTSDGRLWFVTTKGVTLIDPRNIPVNQTPPPVYIENVSINKNQIDQSESIALPPGGGELVFSYTGLSFSTPEKIKFKYKLEGFDTEWVDAGTRREAYYTNVPPGEYKFVVIAGSNNGVWNNTGASYKFYLQPHFYQTAWFYLLIALLLCLSPLLFYRVRVQGMHRQFSMILAERNRISRELHDTVAQEVAGISAQLEAVKAKQNIAPQEADRHLDRARNLAHQCLNDARRFVRDLRPQAIESGSLMNVLGSVAEQLTCDTNVQINLEVTGTPRNLPSEIETNLLRIGQEAIINAVRHAHPQQIDVELDFKDDQVSLCVRDDGCGFSSQTLERDANHFGVVGMHERAAQLGGKLIIRGSPHKGTEVAVTVSV